MATMTDTETPELRQEQIRGSRLKPGDRVLGVGTVRSVKYDSRDSGPGGDVERDQYLVTFTDGHKRYYSGLQRATVIRDA